MTREEKFIELGKLYDEIHRLTNRAMELIDSPSAEKEFEKAITDHKQKEARKTKTGRKKYTRTKRETLYMCRECKMQFTSTIPKMDVTCNSCGSPHIDYAS
jgi:rubrerythrin